MVRLLPRVFPVILSMLALAGVVSAQTTGTIRGVVKDPSGAVVPGAKVSAIQEATHITRSVTAASDGAYQFPVLPVGAYALEVDAAGFKKYVQRGIDVSIGRVAAVDITLEVGEVSEVVMVEGGAPLVETSSTQIGAVVNDRTVVSLPLNARDTYQLLQLQPGVQSQVGADLFYGSDRAGVVSVNGGRGRANNFTVNGGDGNDLFVNLPAIQPSPDAIEEFRVLTNTFDAEFGRNSGAVVNVVTKSGSNSFHGNTFEFFRNKVLNSRGFFDVEKPDFKQNQFGFTFGGPIRRDRAFFFTSYEGRRIRRGIPSDVVTVPTIAERTGNFSSTSPFAGTLADASFAEILRSRPGCSAAVAALGGGPIAAGTPYSSIFAGNQIPVECFDRTAFDLLQQFVPLPNAGASGFQSAPLARERDDQFTVRVDHQISSRQQFTAYYYFTDQSAVQPFARFQAGGANLPGFGNQSETRVQQWNLSHTWILSPTTINEFRFNYFREGQETFLHPVRTSLVQASCAGVPASDCFSDPTNPRLGITPGLGTDREGVPFIDIAGGFSIGNNFEGELPQVGNSFQWTDNISKVWGSHTTKFGADFRRQRFDQTLFFDVNGSQSIFGGGPNDPLGDNLFPSYLLGLTDFYLQGAAQRENVRSTSIYLFGQDSWKLRSNLTLNYGLRWELNTPLGDIGKRVQTFRPGQSTGVFPCQLSPDNPLTAIFGSANCNPGGPADAVFPLGLVVPGDRGISDALTQTYFKSFAPRIGLAWSPQWESGWLKKLAGEPGKTSVRMGWGVFYNPVEQLVLEQFSAEPPFGGSSGLSNVLLNTPFLGQDGTVNPNPFNGILNPARGKAIDWSVFRPILLFGQFQPDLRSQYSVQYNLTLQRELSKDLVFQIAYVGSQGHRLLATHDVNFGNAQTCLDLQKISDLTGNPDLSCGPFFADSAFFIPAGTIPAGVTLHLPYGKVSTVRGPNPTDITLVGLRPFSSPLCNPTTGKGCPPDGVPVFSSIFAQDTIANSNYHSLQLMVEKRFSRGLQLQGSYTWSKSIDNASSFEDILNPFNFRADRALSKFDARHRFVLNYYWELPIRKSSGARGKLINGWAVSGITTFQTGFPIRITSSDDLELQNSFDFELPGRPNLVGPFRTMDPRKNPGGLFFDPSAFAPQALGSLGTAPRTICCGPGINNFDIGVHKSTDLTERLRMEFRAEFFNVFNHAQFTNPSGNITDGSDFGKVIRVRDPRQVQFALKLFF